MTVNDPRQGEGAAPEERDPRLAQLYRAGSAEEPPAHLDAAILAAARREVGAKPKRLGAALRAWRVPVSIAAVIVLSMSLVTLVLEEGADRLAEIPAVGPPDSPALAPPRAAKPESRGPLAGERAAEATKIPAPTAPEPVRQAPVPPRVGAVTSRDAPAAVPAPGRVAAPFPGAEKERREPDDALRQSVPREAKPEAAASRADREGASPVAAGVLGATPAPARAAAEAARPRSEAAPLAGERQTTTDVQKSVLLRQLDREPPEKWLRRIEELRQQGERALADEVLAEFKRRFPGHALPPGMR